jgi:hypothetical protein
MTNERTYKDYLVDITGAFIYFSADLHLAWQTTINLPNLQTDLAQSFSRQITLRAKPK